jgi:hypothetical protein
MSTANNGKRYVRYKVFLSTTDTSKTPVLTSINLNFVTGCPAPGQVMFEGLESSITYQIRIEAAGYPTQTISDLSVSGYNVLEVLLTK